MSDVYATPKSDPENTSQLDPEDTLKRALAGQYDFNLSAVFSEAWQLTDGIKWRTHLALLVYGLVPILFFLVVGIFAGAVLFSNGIEEADLEGMADSMQLAADAFGIISTIIFMPLNVGLGMIGLKRATGRDFRISESLCYFQYYPALAVIGLVWGLISFVSFGLPGYNLWFLIFLLPGLYLSVAIFYSTFLVVEKNFPAIESLKISFTVIRHHWFKFFGLLIYSYLLNFLGALLLLLGLLWTVPLTLVAIGIVYRDVFGSHHREVSSDDNTLSENTNGL